MVNLPTGYFVRCFSSIKSGGGGFGGDGVVGSGGGGGGDGGFSFCRVCSDASCGGCGTSDLGLFVGGRSCGIGFFELFGAGLGFLTDGGSSGGIGPPKIFVHMSHDCT